MISPPPDFSTLERSEAANAPVILLLDFSSELRALFAEWLLSAGFRVFAVGSGEALTGSELTTISATIAHLPFPRLGGAQRVDERAAGLRGRPIMLVSPAFSADISPVGAVAIDLGVDAVLPASVGRESLIAAVRAMLRPFS